jgi:hypothetical protein
VEKPQIRDTVCDLFHIGHDAYSQIVGVYLHNWKVYQTGGRSISFAKETCTPRTKAMQIAVRDFVRGRWMNQQCVTARQVLDFLVDQKQVVVPVHGAGG